MENTLSAILNTGGFVVTDEPSIRAQRYIEWGEEQGYHLRSVTKN